jgi:hypothetical protein
MDKVFPTKVFESHTKQHGRQQSRPIRFYARRNEK